MNSRLPGGRSTLGGQDVEEEEIALTVFLARDTPAKDVSGSRSES